MECHSCGARLISGEKECPRCGARVDGEGGIAGPPEFEFRIPKESRELRDLLNHTPSSIPARSGQIFTTVFGLVFTLFAVFFIFIASLMGAPLLFKVFPVIFVIVGVGVVMQGVSGLAKLTRGPLERLPAVVVGKRQHYDTDSEGSGSTTYYVNLQTENGNRKEHLVPGKLYGQLERGDTGVAYLKGGFLLDFRRLRLPGSSGKMEPQMDADEGTRTLV